MKHVDDEVLNDVAKSYQVVKHRSDKLQRTMAKTHSSISQLRDDIDLLIDDLDTLLNAADQLLDGNFEFTEEDETRADELLRDITEDYVYKSRYEYEKRETLKTNGSWEELMNEVSDYASKNDIDFGEDPFDGLLSETEKNRIAEKILKDYRVVMDPEERLAAIEMYLSYGMLFASVATGNSVDNEDTINRLCDLTKDLLSQTVDIDSRYNHSDYLKKPKTINAWLSYFNRFYPDIMKSTGMALDSIDEETENEDEIMTILNSLSKIPTWPGLGFSLIYQFVLPDEHSDLKNSLFIINKSDGPVLRGKTATFKMIAGFVNWMDALCSVSKSKASDFNAEGDIRSLVMSLLGKCNFGKPDQEGIIKSIQEFAIDVLNIQNIEFLNNENTLQIGICDYIMKFLAAVQKKAEGLSYYKSITSIEEKFVNGCQVAGYGTLSFLKKNASLVGKADFVSPAFVLVKSVDVDKWAEYTYQALVQARTVFQGYYLDIKKMDEDLDQDWNELLKDESLLLNRLIKK